MSENSRSFFAIQIALGASQAEVDQAIAMIRGAAAARDGVQPPVASGETAAPVAPTAPAPQVTPAEVASAELDADGLPWDERIHAGTKTKTAKGIWTKRRGTPDATYNKVVAELRQQYPAADNADADTTDTTDSEPEAPAAPTVAAPAAPSISVPTAAPAGPYTELVDWLAKNTGDGKALSKEWVEQQFSANGTSLAALAGNDEHAKAFLDAFKAALAQVGG